MSKEKGIEQELEKEQDNLFSNLSEEDKDKLSKALFPSTHTDKVTVLDKERKLRPLPIKYSRQLYTLTKPLAEKIRTIFESPEVTEMDNDLIDVLFKTVKIIAEFYKWEDVLKVIDDEGISLGELQAVTNIQVELNGLNDFTVGPLRIIIQVMKVQELIVIQYQNLCTIAPPSKDGIVPSTS